MHGGFAIHQNLWKGVFHQPTLYIDFTVPLQMMYLNLFGKYHIGPSSQEGLQVKIIQEYSPYHFVHSFTITIGFGVGCLLDDSTIKIVLI